MNLFQLITLPLVGLLFIRSIIVLLGRTHPRSVSLLAVLIWLAAGIAILKPDITIQIAGLLGIGRGADLVLYLLVISFLILFFYIYNRLRRIESNITEIVRQLALRGETRISSKENFEESK